MKKLLSAINKNLYIQIFLLLIAFIFTISSYTRSQEADMALLFPVQMQGEYSQDGGEWKTYQVGEKISALKGDLKFRGNFELDLSEVSEFHFYLDHVELTIYRNGEKVFSSVPEFPLSAETTCVENWCTWYCEPVQVDDILEIHLHNPHNAGNVQAYQSFFDSIYGCPESMLQGRLHMLKQKEEIVALVVLIIAIILLGMAAGGLVIDYELGRKLWPLGLLTLFMGGYILFDLPIDIINYYKDILVPEIEYLSDTKMVAFGTGRILIFDGAQKPEAAGEIVLEQEISSYFYNDKYIGIVYDNPDLDNVWHVKVMDLKGKLVMENDISIPYTKVEFLSNNEICATNNMECELFTLQSIKKLRTFWILKIQVLPEKSMLRLCML